MFIFLSIFTKLIWISESNPLKETKKQLKTLNIYPKCSWNGYFLDLLSILMNNL